MVHDGEDRIVDGEAVSRHDTSVVNPVPVPETAVPAVPDVGVSVRVPGGPAVTANVADAISFAFVETEIV
jgi:hypothetical protein